MNRPVAAVAVIFCLSGITPAADRQLVGLMMPDAKVLAGVNATQIRTSPFGQFLISKITTADANFQQFVQATGFDPTRDILEIVAASPGTPGQHIGLAAIRGTFDVEHIVGFLQGVGVPVDRSAGVPVLASPDGQGAFAFLDGTLAVAGDRDNVMAAIGRRSAPSALDPVLTTKGQALSAAQDAWVVSTMTPSSVRLPGGPGPGNGLNLSALQSIQQSSAGVKFGATVNISAEAVADTAQNANALADVVRLLLSLAQMNQPKDPQGAQFMALLKNLTVQTNGAALDLTLAIPEDLIEQLSPANHGPHPARRVALHKDGK